MTIQTADSGESARGQSSRGSRRVAAFLGVLTLCAAVSAIYGPAVHSPFIFDDLTTVVNNPSIRRLWPLFDLSGRASPLTPPKNLPTSARPLVNLSLAINYHFGELDPTGYHVVHIALHALLACLLWAIVHRTLRLPFFQQRFDRVAGLLSFASALIWTVHPLNTETVNYTTQRTELMMGWFYLLTLYGSLRYWSANARFGRISWLALATVACASGMLSKEVMASAPIVVLLFDRTFISASFRRALRASWPLYLGLAAGWIPLLWIYGSGFQTPEAGFNLEVRAVAWWYTQAKVLFMYFKLTLWPWPLVIHYEMPYLESLTTAWPWLAAVGLLGVVTLWLVWRRTAAGFVGAWVLAILSPTLLIPMANEVAAERRMYLPLAAIFPLLVAGGYVFARRVAQTLPSREGRGIAGWGPIATIVVAVLAVTAVFSLLSVRRLAAYHDALALWQDAAVHQPNNYTVRYNQGTVLALAGRRREAIEQLEIALQLKPGSSDAHFNLARALDESGSPLEALGYYAEAVRLKPDFAAAHHNLGVLLAEAGQTRKAIDHYQETVRLQPEFAAARVNLATALASVGRIEDAISQLEKAAELKPESDVLANLAFAYAQANREAEAIAMAERARDLARSRGDAPMAAHLDAWLARRRQRAP